MTVGWGNVSRSMCVATPPTRARWCTPPPPRQNGRRWLVSSALHTHAFRDPVFGLNQRFRRAFFWSLEWQAASINTILAHLYWKKSSELDQTLKTKKSWLTKERNIKKNIYIGNAEHQVIIYWVITCQTRLIIIWFFQDNNRVEHDELVFVLDCFTDFT